MFIKSTSSYTENEHVIEVPHGCEAYHEGDPELWRLSRSGRGGIARWWLYVRLRRRQRVGINEGERQTGV
jgi:hypothetical protein